MDVILLLESCCGDNELVIAPSSLILVNLLNEVAQERETHRKSERERRYCSNDREREWKGKLEEGVQQSIRALRGGRDSNSRL